jgi:hypothetical protein
MRHSKSLHNGAIRYNLYSPVTIKCPILYMQHRIGDWTYYGHWTVPKYNTVHHNAGFEAQFNPHVAMHPAMMWAAAAAL